MPAVRTMAAFPEQVAVLSVPERKMFSLLPLRFSGADCRRFWLVGWEAPPASPHNLQQRRANPQTRKPCQSWLDFGWIDSRGCAISAALQMVASLDPVVNVSMHSEGRYAFVELRTPEMASAALQLSGQVGTTLLRSVDSFLPPYLSLEASRVPP